MAALVVATQPSPAAITRALLSVEGLAIPKDESITAFEIDAWGVEFLAVCHLPYDWEIKADKYQDPEGLLSGRAGTLGEPLRELRGLFLVDVYDYQPLARGSPTGEYHPASFAGWVQIASTPGSGGVKTKLLAKNFRLTNATNCPEPPPSPP
jgi:hypothetical protein